jgi:hypothetical protein
VRPGAEYARSAAEEAAAVAPSAMDTFLVSADYLAAEAAVEEAVMRRDKARAAAKEAAAEERIDRSAEAHYAKDAFPTGDWTA